MGCCEGHSYSPYLLSPKSAAAYHSILLKEKRPSHNKHVRFEISYTNFKELSIREELEVPWYVSDLANGYDWEYYKSSEKLSLHYIKEETKILISSTLSLNSTTGHKSIICLLNNPKYRLIWDNDLRTMEVLFGEANLDATVSLMDKWEDKARLYERNVRKFGSGVYIHYAPFDENLKDNFLIFAIHSPDKLQIYWKEDLTEDYEFDLHKKFIWANKLYDEIQDQKSM